MSGSVEAGRTPSVSKWAVASGYIALVPFCWTFYLFPFAYAGFPESMNRAGMIRLVAVTVLGAIIPPLSLAVSAHREVRRRPAVIGRRHIGFAYFAVAIVSVTLAVAMMGRGFHH